MQEDVSFNGLVKACVCILAYSVPGVCVDSSAIARMTNDADPEVRYKTTCLLVNACLFRRKNSPNMVSKKVRKTAKDPMHHIQASITV